MQSLQNGSRLAPLVVTQHGQEFLLLTVQDPNGLGLGRPASTGRLNYERPSITGVWRTNDEAAPLEIVDERNHRRPVDAQDIARREGRRGWEDFARELEKAAASGELVVDNVQLASEQLLWLILADRNADPA